MELKEATKCDLKLFLDKSKERLSTLLKQLQWTEEDILKDFNTNSKAVLQNAYAEADTTEEKQLPESYGSKNSVVIDQITLQQVIKDDYAQIPQYFSDIQINFSREQKLQLYEYVVEHTVKFTEPELKVRALNENQKTFAEIVAKKNSERKKKRRRFRQTKPTHNEELRALVELQMQAFQQYLRGSEDKETKSNNNRYRRRENTASRTHQMEREQNMFNKNAPQYVRGSKRKSHDYRNDKDDRYRNGKYFRNNNLKQNRDYERNYKKPEENKNYYSRRSLEREQHYKKHINIKSESIDDVPLKFESRREKVYSSNIKRESDRSYLKDEKPNYRNNYMFKDGEKIKTEDDHRHQEKDNLRRESQSAKSSHKEYIKGSQGADRKLIYKDDVRKRNEVSTRVDTHKHISHYSNENYGKQKHKADYRYENNDKSRPDISREQQYYGNSEDANGNRYKANGNMQNDRVKTTVFDYKCQNKTIKLETDQSNMEELKANHKTAYEYQKSESKRNHTYSVHHTKLHVDEKQRFEHKYSNSSKDGRVAESQSKGNKYGDNTEKRHDVSRSGEHIHMHSSYKKNKRKRSYSSKSDSESSGYGHHRSRSKKSKKRRSKS